MSIEGIIKRNLVALHHVQHEQTMRLMGAVSTCKASPNGENLARQHEIEEAIETSLVLENQLACLIDIRKKVGQS